MADKSRQAKQEIESAKAEITRLQQRITDLEAYLRVHTSLRTSSSDVPKRKDSAAKQAIADAAAKLLADGSQMKTPQIVSSLQANGVPIVGANPVPYVSQILSRDDRFKPNRKSGWTLATNNVVRIVGGAN